MKQKWSLNPEAFDQLLTWLNADRERAGEKYEEIRSKLIKVYARRGCTASEELADETMDRVARKIHQGDFDYVGDPALYFFGVAQNVYREYLKGSSVERPEELRPTKQQAPPTEDKEQLHQCLDCCLDLLDGRSREIVLAYYGEEKSAKIDYRRFLAEKLGLALSALRMRVHRIKNELQKCVAECVRQYER